MKAIFACLFVGFMAVPAMAASFEGYPCTQDCSGHEAGYDWAERRGIDDPDDCSGNSNSFVEGCRAWAESQEKGNDLMGDEEDQDAVSPNDTSFE